MSSVILNDSPALVRGGQLYPTSHGDAGGSPFEDFLGKPTYPLDLDPTKDLHRPYSNIDLAYRDRVPALESTLIFTIVSANEWPFRVMPPKYTTDIKMRWVEFEANNTLAPITPEQAPPHIVSTKTHTREAFLVRRSLGFMVSHDFNTTPLGQQIYAINIAIIKSSVLATIYQTIIDALFQGQNWYKEYHRRYKTDLTDPNKALEWEKFTWARMNKGRKGWYFLDAYQRRLFKEVRQIVPDFWVVPPSLVEMLTLIYDDNTDYYIAGPKGPQDLKNYDGLYKTFRGAEVYPVESYVAQDISQQRLNQSVRVREDGDAWVQGGRGEENILDGSYISRCLSVKVFEDKKQDFRELAMRDVVRYTYRFDEEGTLTRAHYRLLRDLESLTTKTGMHPEDGLIDIFITDKATSAHINNGETTYSAAHQKHYRVCENFGDIELAYFAHDKLKLFGRSVENAIRRTLTEKDIGDYEAGKGLIKRLYDYPINDTTKAFLFAASTYSRPLNQGENILAPTNTGSITPPKYKLLTAQKVINQITAATGNAVVFDANLQLQIFGAEGAYFLHGRDFLTGEDVPVASISFEELGIAGQDYSNVRVPILLTDYLRFFQARGSAAELLALRGAGNVGARLFQGIDAAGTDLAAAAAIFASGMIRGPTDPFGYGNIPGIRELAKLARGGEEGRRGFREEDVEVAAGFDRVLEKLVTLLKNISGKGHSLFDAKYLPYFNRSSPGNEESDVINMVGQEIIDHPKTTLFIRNPALSSAPPNIAGGGAVAAGLIPAVDQTANVSAAIFVQAQGQPPVADLPVASVGTIDAGEFDTLISDTARSISLSQEARHFLRPDGADDARALAEAWSRKTGPGASWRRSLYGSRGRTEDQGYSNTLAAFIVDALNTVGDTDHDERAQIFNGIVALLGDSPETLKDNWESLTNSVYGLSGGEGKRPNYYSPFGDDASSRASFVRNVLGGATQGTVIRWTPADPSTQTTAQKRQRLAGTEAEARRTTISGFPAGIDDQGDVFSAWINTRLVIAPQQFREFLNRDISDPNQVRSFNPPIRPMNPYLPSRPLAPTVANDFGAGPTDAQAAAPIAEQFEFAAAHGRRRTLHDSNRASHHYTYTYEKHERNLGTVAGPAGAPARKRSRRWAGDESHAPSRPGGDRRAVGFDPSDRSAVGVRGRRERATDRAAFAAAELAGAGLPPNSRLLSFLGPFVVHSPADSELRHRDTVEFSANKVARWTHAYAKADNDWQRIGMHLFVLSPISGDQVTRWLDNDIMIPFEVLNVRIARTFQLGAAIVGKRGLGTTPYGNDDFALGPDATSKVALGHFTFYHGAIVKRPDHYAVVPDVYIVAYVGGMGLVYYTGPEDYQLGSRKDDTPDAFAFLVPYGTHKTIAAVGDVAGYYSAGVRARVKNGNAISSAPQWPSALYYSSVYKFYRLHESGDPYDAHFLSKAVHKNSVWRITTHFVNNPEQRRPTNIVIGDDDFGNTGISSESWKVLTGEPEPFPDYLAEQRSAQSEKQ